MTTQVRPHEVWRAGPSGTAHAHLLERPLRTACGVEGIELRRAWPARRRCPECVAALEGRPIGS